MIPFYWPWTLWEIFFDWRHGAKFDWPTKLLAGWSLFIWVSIVPTLIFILAVVVPQMQEYNCEKKGFNYVWRDGECVNMSSHYRDILDPDHNGNFTD